MIRSTMLSRAESIRRAKKNTILNKNLILRLEEDGVEMRTFQGARDQYIGARRTNPLEKLYRSKRIDRQQFAIAEKYQTEFKIATIETISKPSYDGTSLSSISSKPCNRLLTTERRLEASRYIDRMKKLILRRSQPRIFKDFKRRKHKTSHRTITKDLKLDEILRLIFEKEIALYHVEATLNMHNNTLLERIKLICEILLDYK